MLSSTHSLRSLPVLQRRRQHLQQSAPRVCVVSAVANGTRSPTVVARWSLDAKFGCKTETIGLVLRAPLASRPVSSRRSLEPCPNSNAACAHSSECGSVCLTL